MIGLVVFFLLLRPAFVHRLRTGGHGGVRHGVAAAERVHETAACIGQRLACLAGLRAGICGFRRGRLAAGSGDRARREDVRILVIAFVVFVFRQRDIFLVQRLSVRPKSC